MSPRLLFLLTSLRTRDRFECDRDRIDARLAATRIGARPTVSLHAMPDPVDLLPVAA
jgi:hypothetical protein